MCFSGVQCLTMVKARCGHQNGVDMELRLCKAKQKALHVNYNDTILHLYKILKSNIHDLHFPND
jgi:hypothetical protein